MEYNELHYRLIELEQLIRDERPLHNKLATLIRTNRCPVQGYGLSRATRGRDLPVVVAVGVNYSQNTMVCPRDTAANGVEDALTNCRAQLDQALAAYRRHRVDWASENRASSEILDPPSEYHFVAANFCLWITSDRWLKLRDDDRKLLLESNPLFDSERTGAPDWPHLDRLAVTLKSAPVLWVPHGLNGGALQLFAVFRTTRMPMNWIMTPNLSYPYKSYGTRFPRDMRSKTKHQ
jgi:hypothetical protein